MDLVERFFRTREMEKIIKLSNFSKQEISKASKFWERKILKFARCKIHGCFSIFQVWSFQIKKLSNHRNFRSLKFSLELFGSFVSRDIPSFQITEFSSVEISNRSNFDISKRSSSKIVSKFRKSPDFEFQNCRTFAFSKTNVQILEISHPRAFQTPDFPNCPNFFDFSSIEISQKQA